MTERSTQILTYPPHIYSILQRLLDERTLLGVRLEENATLYNSAVLRVQPQQSTFVLDELTPHDGHTQVRPGSALHIHGRLRGVQVHLDSHIARIEYENDIALYYLPIPAELVYRQRRRHFRALLQDKQAPAIVLPIELQKRVAGRLVDISVGGVCSRVATEDARQLEQAQAVHNARITLPGLSHTITCDLAIRSLRHYPDNGYALIGSEIVAIEPRSRQTIERFVAKQDRAHQRNIRL
jgi:c-di-GMP-binding flagellar brake protein YcgR